MHLTAVFEEWHIGDGNYPPLHKGMDVNLAFQVEHSGPLQVAPSGSSLAFEHLGNAEYRFVAKIARIYTSVDSSSIAICETSEFRFYIEHDDMRQFQVGTVVQGTGTLLLDYYIWVEYLSSYPDPPDLFYNLQVERIRKVRISERFIARYERGKSLPTRIPPHELQTGDYEEIDTMEGQNFDECFCDVDFESLQGRSVPRTFR